VGSSVMSHDWVSTVPSSSLTNCGGGFVRTRLAKAKEILFESFSKTRGAIVLMSVEPCTLYLKAERNPSRSFFVNLRLTTSSAHVSWIIIFISSTEMFPFLSVSTRSRKYFSKVSYVPNLSYKCLFTLTSCLSIASSLFAGTFCESRTKRSSLKTFLWTRAPK